jgi:pimeloyl-ACP methyl ester carboxylesterase
MAKYVLPIQVDKGSGPVVVLLHGLGNNYKSWSYVLKHIDDSVRVIAVDLLGFGDAPKPDVEYTPADHAAAVLHTLDSLGIQKALIAGHSMGCLVAIEVAHQRPELVTQLVLAGAPLYQKKRSQTPLGKIFHSTNIYFAIYDALKKNPDLAKAGGQIAEDILPFVNGMEITDETWPAFTRSLSNTIMQYETLKVVEALKTPTLFLNGLLDFFIIRKVTSSIVKKNKKYLKEKTVFGPHELTPRNGRRLARRLKRLARSAATR